MLVSLLAYAWFHALHTSGEEKEFVKEIGGNAGTLSVLAVCALDLRRRADLRGDAVPRLHLPRRSRNWRGAVAGGDRRPGPVRASSTALSAPAVDLLPLALLGVVLCVVYQSTGSLYPCIAVHMVNNALALGSDESWGPARVVALMAGALAVGALVLAAVRLASERWTPATG